MSLNKLHLISRILKEDLNCTSFLNTKDHAVVLENEWVVNLHGLGPCVVSPGSRIVSDSQDCCHSVFGGNRGSVAEQGHSSKPEWMDSPQKVF